MIAARTTGDPAYLEMIGEMDKEMIEMIEYFDRAMSFEALRLVNEMGKLSFFQFVDSGSSGVWCRTSRARAS